MFRVAVFAVLVMAYCGISSGCCCCSDFMKGFNKGFQQGLQKAQKQAEEDRRRAEEDQKKLIEQQNKDKNNPEKTSFEFIVRTGQFTLNNQPIGQGFSGTGAARNNPDLVAQPKTGPIPVGTWRVSAKRPDAKTGEPTIDLQFFNGVNVKGRIPGENFTIHPENGPNAGQSGIAAPRNVRDQFQVGNMLRVNSQ
jgi:hypothetical protein